MKWNYDKISPVTGNRSVVVSGESELCLESGYEKFFGPNLDTFLKLAPDMVRESEIIDQNGNKWFKTLRFSPDSVLVPVSDGWEVNTFRDLYIDEENTFEVSRVQKDIVNGDYEKVLDPNQAKHYLTFLEAFEEFNKRLHQEI